MKPTPPGWPRISSSLYYDDAVEAIDWLQEAFGFELRLKVEGEGGRIEHSELTYGDGVIMVAGSDKVDKYGFVKSPTEAGGNTQNMMVYVDDVEAHYQTAKAAGAKITQDMKTSDYGEDYWSDKGYGCEDVGGHHWWFMQRLRSAEPKA